jgi:hypothetical protein
MTIIPSASTFTAPRFPAACYRELQPGCTQISFLDHPVFRCAQHAGCGGNFPSSSGSDKGMHHALLSQPSCTVLGKSKKKTIGSVI